MAPSPLLRVVLLRRLRLPLPVAVRTCACLPLELAVARVCQEAGARVARNVRLAEMNIDVPVSDDRRVEVVANGLSLWHGAQHAVEAAIASPVPRAGETQPGADLHPGRAVDSSARRQRHHLPRAAG